MNVKFLLKCTALLLSSKYVLASSNACEDLKNEFDAINCLSKNDGKDITLSVKKFDKSGEELSKINNVEKLFIDCSDLKCKINDNVFSQLKNLTELHLNGMDISQANINELGELPNLKNLILTYCYNTELDYSPLKNILTKDGSNKNYPKVCREDPEHCNLNISTTGKCGVREGKCPEGECCSRYGVCGKDEKSCGFGCQSEFGHCDPVKTITKTATPNTSFPISTNGKCGGRNGICPEGECCSKYGYCGKSEKHCSISQGCQSAFGICLTLDEILKLQEESENALPNTHNGRCGPAVGKCPESECCSKYGYCGTSFRHCSISEGCKSEFGHCNEPAKTATTTQKSVPTSTNGKCGKKEGHCPEGECCSKYGFCGTNFRHCSLAEGCQSEFGRCD